MSVLDLKASSNISLNTVLVSCEDKEGLVDNTNHPELPSCGLLGTLALANPEIVFLSSGGTYKLLKQNGFHVIDFEEYTASPQMKDGLVKSIDYKIHSSILAQDFIKEDIDFLSRNSLLKIDAVITNFNCIYVKGSNKISSFEELESYRNKIDIGGPLMCMSARKGVLNTLLLTDPNDYKALIVDLNSNGNKCSLAFRLEMVKKGNEHLKKYNDTINDLYNMIDSELFTV